MTTNGYIVDVRGVDKLFRTHHILQRDEDTGQRRLYHVKTVHAAQKISFAIRPGEIFGLLGPNGAGKTTTVKMISGLVRPDSGQVLVDGLHVEKKRLKVLRKIGVVLEGVRTCIWPLTPLENLAYFGNLKDVRGKVLRERSRELLEFIGLKDKMNIQVRRLSRGEKQKLAICIALIADPPVVLLDEPTTGLDVQSSRAIKDKIIEMTRTQGKCALVTTHDMHVAQELCDRIGIIDKGQLITCRPTEELLDVFSDQVYALRLDALPAEGSLEGLPGIVSVTVQQQENDCVCCVTLEADVEQRSNALYSVMDALKAQGRTLRSITHQQQTLESVFLRLTTGSMGVPPASEV